MLAYDEDKSGTPNSTFHYAIKSVSPETSNVEFFIKETGALYFKGCFDHEARHSLIKTLKKELAVNAKTDVAFLVHLHLTSNH